MAQQQQSIDDLQRQLEVKQRLEEINKKIFSSLELPDVIRTISSEASELMHTDTTTVFVVDFDTTDKPKELFTLALKADTVTEIRVPCSDSSFAGYVATHNQFLHIPDVYNDAEVKKISTTLAFDKSWDRKTGFRTRNMLVAPIQYDNKTIGVIEAINKKNNGVFTTEDTELLQKFAYFCGLAINNAHAHKAAITKVRARMTLNDILVKNNVCTQDIIDKANDEAKKTRKKITDILADQFSVSDSGIAQAVAELNNLVYMEMNDEMTYPKDLVEKLSEKFARKNLVCPYRTVEDDGKPGLVVFMVNPKDFYTIDSVEMALSMKIKTVYVTTKREVHEMITRALKGYKGAGGAIDEGPVQNVDALIDEVSVSVGQEEQNIDMVEVEEGATEDQGPVVKLANHIIEEAYRKKASDIHIEPYEQYVLVRYRRDGILEKALTFPRHARKAVVSRFKIMAEMNITERRLPQDGRIKFKQFGGKFDIELRVNSCPTVGEENEDMVMRILADSKPIPLQKSGMMDRVFDPFMKMVHRPYGMVLVVGPTGSGKTTTLHSAVGTINDSETKILTAENPVEITQPGLRQVQVKPEIGLDFKSALRSFLRQDPDVVMVGEMRDFETCSIAVEAALTGHLLFSTLHTNNAPETVTRLVDIGIDPVTLSDALLCVLAQRLVRRICGECKEEYVATDDELKEFGYKMQDGKYVIGHNLVDPGFKVFRTKGCAKCDNKGYKGRLAVHELLLASQEVKRMICAKAKVQEIRQAAIMDGGMVTLLQDGLEKAVLGMTTPNEVHHSCSE